MDADFKELRGRRGGPGAPHLEACRGLKRKGAPGADRPAEREQKQKRRRRCRPQSRAEAEEEEALQVGLALSRSLRQQEAQARRRATGKRSRSRREPAGGVEKKHCVMPPHSPPTLLLQDPAEARRQTEERVALLLSEAGEFPSTPALLPSRLLASGLSREVAWPKGPPSSLWEHSSLVGLSAAGPIGVAGSILPVLPRQTDQRLMESTAVPSLGSAGPEAQERLLPGSGCGRDLHGKSSTQGGEAAEGCCRNEEGALQDLMELAGEGMTLTQWNPAGRPVEDPGEPEWVPGDVPRSSHDPSREKALPLGSPRPPFLLGLLAVAFKGMVNNPHLSDVQFQVDSGELFYAHMFVLYARCPRLMEVVEEKGFWVAEGGDAKTRRVLLSDVSGEAAGAFLTYLYTAEPSLPRRVLPDVAALAERFGVAELAALCRSRSWSGRPAAGASGQEEDERGGKFEELLKSIWVGEEEPMISGQEETAAFTSPQRKAEEGRSSERSREGEEAGAFPAEGQGSPDPDPSPLRAQDAEEEPLPGTEEQRPLGAVGRGRLELAGASRELGEKSLLAVSWGAESLELFQQSRSGTELSDGEVAAVPSSTPLGLEKGFVPLPRDFPTGGSQVPLGVLADKLPGSPDRRGGFCSDLSLALFSPPPPEARGEARQLEERPRAPSAPAPLPSPSPLDPEAGPLLMLSPADGRQAEMTGLPSREREVAFGALNSPPCGQGRGVPLLGMHPGGEANAGGERIHVLSRRGSNGGQVAKPSSTSGPGDAQDNLSPPPWSSACPPSEGASAADVVVILDDSDEEAEAAPQLSWGSSLLEVERPTSEEDSGQLSHGASPPGWVATEAGGCRLGSPPRALLRRSGTPPRGSRTAALGRWPRCGRGEEESCSSDGDQELMEVLPLTQRVAVPKTPDLVCQGGGAACTTPPTPMPSYSIMETPVLKKELNRFGVRTLPKQQMVLKLKEIFQYTHQRSDSRDATQAALRPPLSAATRSGSPQHVPGYPELPQVLLTGGRSGGSRGAGHQGPGRVAKRGRSAAGPGRRKRAAEGPVRGGQAPSTSQKAVGLSGATTDWSVVPQSSSTECESSVPAEEEEEEEDLAASLSACHEADMLVALREHIRSQPALCRQILLYQPFELAKLQSELKRNGIRVALGRLLEFLDAHCVTFTTAEARREKRQQSGCRGRGRRRY